MKEEFQKKICELFGLSNINDWGDNNRYDRDIYIKLESIMGFMECEATVDEAIELFYMVLGRRAGSERASRTYGNIISDLLSSEEYKMRLVPYHIYEYGSYFFQTHYGNILISISDLEVSGQSLYSCFLEHVSGDLYVSLPRNFSPTAFGHRFLPYIPVFSEVLRIISGCQSKSRCVNFFYGDHPPRDNGIAFCSNRVDDVLVPDMDTLAIFRERGEQKEGGELEWKLRKPVAYFRGTDTGATYYKFPENSQRVALCMMSVNRPDLLDAKITSVELETNKSRYDALGIVGAREPQGVIGKYKFNLDVDGNSNSWIGLVNKLYFGAGGVVLKVASPEGYRQWFYGRLQPWVNYVPIDVDMLDLFDKIEYLIHNDAIAESIYRNSINIFSGIDYRYLVNYSAHMFALALVGIKPKI